MLEYLDTSFLINASFVVVILIGLLTSFILPFYLLDKVFNYFSKKKDGGAEISNQEFKQTPHCASDIQKDSQNCEHCKHYIK